MPRKHYFLRRFAAILSIGMLLSLVLLSFISSRLIIQTFDTIGRATLDKFLDQGEAILTRYVDGEISLQDLDELMNPEISLNLTYLILLDKDSRIIAANHEASGFTDFSVVEAQALELQSEQRYFKAEKSRQSIVGLIIGRPVYRDGIRLGSVFAGITTSETVAARSQYNLNIFMAIWPLFLILMIISLLAARRFIRPIRILTDATRQIAGGQWGTTVDMPLPGEMGSLARDFNEMSVSLAQTIASLNYEKNSMKLMLEGLKEGIVAMDSSGGIMHQNGAALELLGGPDSKEHQAVIGYLKECVQSGETLGGKLAIHNALIEYIIRRIPAERACGRTGPGAIALLRDITVSERLEQTRHDYVANISHELRTPLTAMRGLIEPLRDGLVSDEADRQRCYDTIAAEAMRLSRLVSDLLELSGIQSYSAAFETEAIDTSDLMQDVYYRNRQLFQNAGLQFDLAVPETLPFVCSNEDRVIQVLTIFLDNARKYTPAGGQVTLGAQLAGQGVQITISDTGIGMDEAIQRQIFDRFYQGDQSHNDRGNGLGLSIAREILDKLAIPLLVKSTPGQGSSFALTLPLAGLQDPGTDHSMI